MKKNLSFILRISIIIILLILQVLVITSLVLFVFYIPINNNVFWLSLFLVFIFNFFIALFVSNTVSQSNYKISWLVACLLFPVFGGLLYLIFSKKETVRVARKMKEKYEKYFDFEVSHDNQRILNDLKKENEDIYRISNFLIGKKNTYIYKNTDVTYFSTGEDSFKTIISELESAKKFIFIEYFILEDGLFFESMFDVLEQKIKEGIEVRVIYDDFGCYSKINRNFLKKLKKSNIKFHAFNVVRPIIDFKQNMRDHRKILVIDGVRAFTGGINLADEYININSKFGFWKDNVVLLKGEAVEGLTNIFLYDWNIAKKKKNPLEKQFKLYNYENNKIYDLRENKINNNYIIPISDEPFDGELSARDLFIQMILKAKDYINISTPYLILDDELLNAFIIASKSGVEIKIITPGIPDKKITYQCTQSFYRILSLNNIKIFHYTKGFNHEKMIVVDGIMVETGSINFDYRSLHLNFENGLFFYNVPEIKEMDFDLKNMIKESNEINYKEYQNPKLFKRILFSILRIFSTLF